MENASNRITSTKIISLFMLKRCHVLIFIVLAIFAKESVR